MPASVRAETREHVHFMRAQVLDAIGLGHRSSSMSAGGAALL